MITSPSRVRSITATVLHVCQSTFLALLPAHIQRMVQNEPREPRRVFSTSYLNGFRGVMAFLVFVRHFTLPWQADLDYGLGQGENHTGILRLPPFRILYAGPNVPVFLVVSGYVMSLKPLKLIAKGQKEAFLDATVSSVFRRAARIFPPPIFASFLYMVAVHFSLFKLQYHAMNGYVPPHPKRLPTFFGQLQDWLQFVFQDLTNPWSWKTPNAVYGPHLWTIGLQFRSSMVLFLVQIGLANTRKTVRQTTLVGLFIICMCYGRWDAALYCSGMFLAGVDIGNEGKSDFDVASTLDLEEGRSSTSRSRKHWLRVWWTIVLLLGLYLSCYPRARQDGGAPGWRALYNIDPYYQYWQGCGALLLIWCLTTCKAAQVPFNWEVPQYLGEISFSLYIVHEPLLHVVGYSIMNMVWSITGNETNFRYQLGFVIALILTSTIILVS